MDILKVKIRNQDKSKMILKCNVLILIFSILAGMGNSKIISIKLK